MEEDVPPLEDMSEILKQAEALRERHAQKQVKNTTTPAVKQNGHHTEQKKTETINKVTADKKSASVDSTGNFGGFKKGFLFGGNSSAKPKSQTKPPNKPTSDIPHIKKSEAGDGRKIPEVQEKIAAEAKRMADNKDEWVTDELLKKVEENDNLFKKFGEKKYVDAVNLFQTDPKAAVEKYKDDKEIQEFMTKFCEIMGEHFTGLAEKQGTKENTKKPAPKSKIVELNSETEVQQAKSVPDTANSRGTSETLYTRLPTDGADMSVRSSTNPKQPTAEDERKIQNILSNPETRDILLDPKITSLFETLRNNPAEGQRILQTADTDLQRKIQKLVECGLLQFQS